MKKIPITRHMLLPRDFSIYFSHFSVFFSKCFLTATYKLCHRLPSRRREDRAVGVGETCFLAPAFSVGRNVCSSNLNWKGLCYWERVKDARSNTSSKRALAAMTWDFYFLTISHSILDRLQNCLSKQAESSLDLWLLKEPANRIWRESLKT